MPSSDFDQFVSNLQGEKQSLREFWIQQKNEYIEKLEELYRKIEEFLAPWTSSGAITIEYHPYTIHEEDTGVYDVRKCIIMIGNRSVALTPVGTQLIGTKGRVDVSGTIGRSRLVLADPASSEPRLAVAGMRRDEKKRAEPRPERDTEWVWKIASNPPDVKFSDFNGDALTKLIMDVTNG